MHRRVALRVAASARNLLFFTCILLTACSSQYRVNELAADLRKSGNASDTLQQLESLSSAKRD